MASIADNAKALGGTNIPADLVTASGSGPRPRHLAGRRAVPGRRGSPRRAASPKTRCGS